MKIMRCFCGGLFECDPWTADRRQCQDCGFAVDHGLIELGVKVDSLLEQWDDFQRRKSDPMNQLPARYR
jgi:hypothetical protein